MATIGLWTSYDTKVENYRNQGPNGLERCYWFFSAETIKELQSTFEREAKFGH
jgi:hypothetical protein